ncbi:MAG TPA: RidA family protein [Xanthobacteraceae bacterium]|nr:RidA family protein [Xanthobacteraceae bacterium]
MNRKLVFALAFLTSAAFAQAPAFAQAFEKKTYNYSDWTKGRFAEAVTVVNPGKWIFLAGIGPEREGDGIILHKGDFQAQCVYAWQKIKKILGEHGATVNDIVKTTTYVTDIRHLPLLAKCRAEAIPGAEVNAGTLLNVSQLAWPDMAIEIDVIAVTAK